MLFPESSHHKKYYGSCFMYLSEILSKLQTCEVTNLMTFSDGLLIYDFFYINHTYCNFSYFSLIIFTNRSAMVLVSCTVYVDEILRKLQFFEISNFSPFSDKFLTDVIFPINL